MTFNVIAPILVGVAPDVDKSAFLWGMQAGQRVDSPSIIWAVTGGWGTIVMDTGSGTPEWVSAHHRPFRRTPEQEPLTALTAAGVDPASVRTVLLSHLHYDHCSNNGLFSSAEFVAHRAEAAYATAPYPVHGDVYEAPAAGFAPTAAGFAPTAGFAPPWMGVAGRLRLVDGDVDLAPGVRAIHLPGHTPGMMGLVVETRTGRYVLAGDHCSLRENWEGLGSHRHIPSRTYVDLGDYYRSYEKIEGLDATVLPGHDIRVFDQKQYG